MTVSPGKMARYGAVGLEFCSPMVAGALIGHYLDAYFKTDPYLTLVMFLLGVFAGFYRLVTILRDFQKETWEDAKLTELGCNPAHQRDRGVRRRADAARVSFICLCDKLSSGSVGSDR